MYKIAFLMTLVFLFGCATPYQKIGDTGGYQHLKLAEDVYRVTFLGNGFTEYNRAYDFALLRAAEIGKELGYSHFTVEGQEDCSGTTVVDMGSTSHTSGSVYAYGGSASYYGTTTTQSSKMPVKKPGVVLFVKYYEGEPKGRHLEIHIAQNVINSMEEKYGFKLNP